MWWYLNLFAGIQISTTHSFPVRVKKRSPIPKPNPQMFAIWLFVLVRPFGNKHLETKAERVEMDGNRRMAERGDRRKRRQGGGREGGRGTVGPATESAQHTPPGASDDTGHGPLSPHSAPVPTRWVRLAFKDGYFPSTWSQETTTYKAHPEKPGDGLRPWGKITKEYGACGRQHSAVIFWEV